VKFHKIEITNITVGYKMGSFDEIDNTMVVTLSNNS